MLPLAKPALAVVAILWFQISWTDFLGPVIFLNSVDKFTLALGVYQYASDVGAAPVHHQELLMCVALVMVLPIALVFTHRATLYDPWRGAQWYQGLAYRRAAAAAVYYVVGEPAACQGCIKGAV